MDYVSRFRRKLFIISFLIIVLNAALGIVFWFLLNKVPFLIDATLVSFVWVLLIMLLTFISTHLILKFSFNPLKKLSDIIVFTGHNNRTGSPPKIENSNVAKDLLTTLAQQVYDLASMSAQGKELGTSDSHVAVEQLESSSQGVLDMMSIPVIGLADGQVVTIVNRAACAYLGKESDEIIGKPIYDSAVLSFSGGKTLESWIDDSRKSAAVALFTWEKVRLIDPDGKPLKQFNLSARFTNENPTGTETILAIFDRSDQYKLDDAEVGYVALAVHELRTPMTALRGYIEVLEDELGPTLTPELNTFLRKMKASAQQLTAFVSNILNVARIEENQLVLKLQRQEWKQIVARAMDDLELRAHVYGKELVVDIAEGLPEVGVDRISIHEVLNNLVDNAIKYSGTEKKIIIKSTLNSDGFIETSVQDFGIGIPQAVMPDLFQKFYRSYKSRVQISGTGLGLYLCKAIITAHGGNIWVNSKEGEGSVFSFTILPFDKLKYEQVDGQDAIMREAHGWIKNHNMTRR